MAPPEKRPATYDDLLELPDYRVGEIVEGELYSSPRPSLRHATTSSVLGHLLIGPFQLGSDGPGGWSIVDEPEIHFGKNVLVPDLAGWRRERLAGLDFDENRITIVPDWICEVLSPPTARLDRIRKMRIYARGGVEFAWLIDPKLRSVETFRREADGWTTAGEYQENERMRAAPFEVVEIDLSILWA